MKSLSLVLVALLAVDCVAAIPLEGHFTGQQALYHRRVSSALDWHPTQVAYGDGATTTDDDMVLTAPRATTVSPIDHGADPRGKLDSSRAFRAAIEALESLCRWRGNDLLKNVSRPLVRRLDCGGAVLDLRGGWYSVSEPVRIPAGMGNLWIKGGTIIAAENFSTENKEESFLLVVGSNCTLPVGPCGSNVGVQQLTLDSKKRADGCLNMNRILYSTVGPGIMVLGFSTYGIAASGSGGTMISDVFAGEYPTSDPRAHELHALHGTAISFGSNQQHDGFLTNVIVWSAKIGVVTHGPAQQLIGIHPWNYIQSPKDGHQTSAVDGVGLGMVVTKGARVEDCYFDTVPLVVEMTNLGGHLLVSGNLFMKNSSIILSAPKTHKPTRISDVTITNNMFRCSSKELFGSCERGAILLDETKSSFGLLRDVRIEGNIVDMDAGYKATKATKSVAANSVKSVIFDFGQDLLFPSSPLANGTASCSLRNGKPVAHSIWSADDKHPLRLWVEFAENWTGVVECTVDQSSHTRNTWQK